LVVGQFPIIPFIRPYPVQMGDYFSGPLSRICGCIMLGMKWKADRTTILAAFALVAGGWVRITFFHDLVLGGLLFGCGIILAVRTFFYFRSN